MPDQKTLERLQKNKTMLIEPEKIHGFRVGKPLDFSAYVKLGWEHPRNPDYYDLSNTENADPQILAYFNGINQSNAIDDPIEVFIDGDKLIVLDGATRLTCIAFIKLGNPERFGKIPVTLFKGTREAARIRMVKRNWDGHKKPLSAFEFAMAVYKLAGEDDEDAGLSPQMICEGLGRPKSYTPYIYRIIKSMRNALPEWKQELFKGEVKLTNFLDISENTEEDQKALLIAHMSGEKITGKKAKKQKSKADVRLRVNINKWRDGMTDRLLYLKEHLDQQKVFDSEFEELFTEVVEITGKIEMLYAERLPENMK